MKQIQLTKEKFTIVDDADFDILTKYNWTTINCRGTFYAKARINGRYFYMHRFIMGITDGKKYIDHINHDTLDNRRANLRICTHAENMFNSKKKKGSLSKYNGVSTKRYKNKIYWSSYISINGKTTYIGTFSDEKLAALAFNKEAKKLRGEFANLNIIDD